MTERILPAISLPAPGRAGTGERVARPRPGAVARPAAHTQRKEAFLTTPARAGMLIGGSAAVYAITLAGVAMLQSSGDAAIAARRQPWVDQVAATRAANDAVEAALVRADADALRLAGVYDEVGAEVEAYQARFDSLAALVAEVEGSAAALPTRISLPTVVRRGPISSSASGGGSKAPATNTRTAASGG